MNVSRKMLILDALAYRVRLISWPQLLWLGPASSSYVRSMRRLVRSLEHASLIRRLEILARPSPLIEAPLQVWRVDDPDPDFQAIHYRAEQRNTRPVETVTVFLGTQRLANVLGGACGHRLNYHSAAHDLGVTGAYLHLWKTSPQVALTWQGEDIIAPSRYRQKLPDAILYDTKGEPVIAIEFIGDYPATRIEAFHRDAQSRRLGYEMY